MFPAGTFESILFICLKIEQHTLIKLSFLIYVLFMRVKFGNCGSLEQHGFARNKFWTIDDDPPPLQSNDSQGKSFVDLLLKPSEEDLKCWPHRYEFKCFEVEQIRMAKVLMES